MSRHAAGVLAAFLSLLALPAVVLRAEEKTDEPAPAQQGDTITWTTEVAKAFDQAAAAKKPVMICINSRRVDGGKVEPAAAGLREVVYRDPRIVTKSRKFVCVFLTSEGSSADYGELRARFAISGTIVSPQHIFSHYAHKQGDHFLARREYWPFGKGEDAVKALLTMMDEALAAFSVREGGPAPTPGGEGPDGGAEAPAQPDAPDAPADDAERQAWIDELLKIVAEGAAEKRKAALNSLVANDKDGDCIKRVIALIPAWEKEKDRVPHLVDVVRVLGIPDLGEAALAMHDLLKHKDDSLRANVAVTLEYIGSPESVAELKGRAPREKVEVIANHLYRALGRCGKGDSKVRALLLKKAKGAKSEWATFGPIVGLAYFEDDPKAARGVEKLLKAMGPPGGRRGGGAGTMTRALLAWCLSHVGDAKSGTFMRERMIKPLEHSQAWWTNAVVTYYDNVAKVCEGSDEAAGNVDEGIRRTLGFVGGTEKVHDDARKGRDTSKFEPKADWEVEARSGGGGGRPGGGGGGRKR